MLATAMAPQQALYAPLYAPLAKVFDRDAHPLVTAGKQRNVILDWLFYDIGNLTPSEYLALLNETNREGSILVVWPTGARGDLGVRKFDDHAALRAAPGDLLTRFAIAGVGSSDLGAASFARSVANRYGEPVGAIVAGYGVADLLGEAIGGWFVLGAANRLMKAYHDALDEHDVLAALTLQQAVNSDERQALEPVAGGSDTATLLRLLLDDDRKVASVAGHSKGSLSIAYALEGLALTRKRTAVARAKRMRVTTLGAVVEPPRSFSNLGQYLGALDWFGGLNSEFGVAHETEPMAWHHLNSLIPLHMDVADILRREPD